jgi:hypothetical protein
LKVIPPAKRRRGGKTGPRGGKTGTSGGKTGTRGGRIGSKKGNFIIIYFFHLVSFEYQVRQLKILL